MSQFDALAAACESDLRYDLFLTSHHSTNLVAVASPPNALAIR
jgi:hypothetical protein